MFFFEGGPARAEWGRAAAAVLVTGALVVMAILDPRDQTVWWVVVLGLSLVIVVAGLAAEWSMADGRAYWRAIRAMQVVAAWRAFLVLTRVPAAPAPARVPRLIVAVFGPASAVAGVAMLVRLALA